MENHSFASRHFIFSDHWCFECRHNQRCTACARFNELWAFVRWKFRLRAIGRKKEAGEIYHSGGCHLENIEFKVRSSSNWFQWAILTSWIGQSVREIVGRNRWRLIVKSETCKPKAETSTVNIFVVWHRCGRWRASGRCWQHCTSCGLWLRFCYRMHDNQCGCIFITNQVGFQVSSVALFRYLLFIQLGIIDECNVLSLWHSIGSCECD